MKKIIIFIITILVLGVLAMTSCIQNSKRIEEQKQQKEDGAILQDNLMKNDELQIEEQDIKELIADKDVDKIEEKQHDKLVQKESIQQENEQHKEIQQQEKKQEEIKQEETKQEETKQEETKQEEIKQEETKQEEIKQEEIKIEQSNNEKYETNSEMMNRIREVIQNNETDDMKKEGYEIVEDSTIPELTNEFTFTEKRVINKIKLKSGIIRIYARNYYFNGNFVSTQCFII